MYRILFLALLAVAVMVVVVYAASGTKWERPVVWSLSVVWFMGLVYLTTVRGARSGISGVSLKVFLPILRAILGGSYGLTTNRSVLNVLLFVPFGFLLAHIARERVTLWQVVLSGLAVSLVVETFQLVFHCGVFELDDLVKNTMGAALGDALHRRSGMDG